MKPVRISETGLLDMFRPGATVYIPAASGELAFLQQALARQPDRLDGVGLISCFIPGMNTFDYAGLNAAGRVTTFLLPPTMHDSFVSGRVVVEPMPYSQIANRLETIAPDIAILHVAPPEQDRCSFGVCADFGPIVAGRARRRIAVINRAMPRPLSSPSLPLEAFEAVVEIDAPLLTPTAEAASELDALAAQVAAVIPNGATVQIGLGAAPTAVWRALEAHRDLRLWSGMATDGWLGAARAGALAPEGHVAGFASGGPALLDHLHGSAAIRFADVRTTHGADQLASLPRFHAINSAIEVDLFGQANLEWIGGRLASGVGGAPDFMSAAARAPDGLAILALPATARKGEASRITLRLTSPAISLSRSQIDVVITEYGAAHLFNRGLDARAEALIAIAAPQFRANLAEEWARMRAAF